MPPSSAPHTCDSHTMALNVLAHAFARGGSLHAMGGAWSCWHMHLSRRRWLPLRPPTASVAWSEEWLEWGVCPVATTAWFLSRTTRPFSIPVIPKTPPSPDRERETGHSGGPVAHEHANSFPSPSAHTSTLTQPCPQLTPPPCRPRSTHHSRSQSCTRPSPGSPSNACKRGLAWGDKLVFSAGGASMGSQRWTR